MTTYVQAISAGYAVPRTNFDAIVHSVFRSSANLECGGQERLLLTLLASGEADLPQGIRLGSLQGFTFPELRGGMRATCRDGMLSLRDCSLIIDLREARLWESDLQDLRPSFHDPAVADAWQCAWQALNQRQISHGSELIARNLAGQAAVRQSMWAQQIGASLRSLVEATTKCDPQAAQALESVIGLGPGLTPSGDDLLAGYLIGLWCMAKGKTERLRFLRDLGGQVIRASMRTNDISRAFLVHAAHGQASSSLVDLSTAICSGLDNHYVRQLTGAAMQTGHTSGMDAVTGLLFGLAAWDGARLLV